MGILSFFASIVKNNVTASAIKSNFIGKTDINHFFLDFNSIIHTSSQKILADINVFLQSVLKNLYNNRSVNNNIVLAEYFAKYKMENIQKKIKQDSKPEDVVKMFHEHFTEKVLDKLVITLVINTVLHLVRTYCHNKTIQTLYLGIDGVPGKGKLVEQRQRRYMGFIIENYKKKILAKYKNYLLDQPDYTYLATQDAIHWSRNKITPGTAFMHKMVKYLRSEKIMEKIKTNRPMMNVIISDMYEVGEGEKKIVNYVNRYLSNVDESVMIYSPDADMILLCLLLPVNRLYMLRHNNEATKQANINIYDLIDIRLLKSNISYYVNNNPFGPVEKFDIDRINHDIVCISTLFGNDFVPKIESIDVKQGFQSIMDAYLSTLLKFKDKGYYLINKNKNNESELNFTFLKNIIRALIPVEEDFIRHNNLYREYIKIGQIKYVFGSMEINSENLVGIMNDFIHEYNDLKHAIRQRDNLLYFETNDQFMDSLKKAINITDKDGASVNTLYLKNKELIQLLINYYRQNRDFPKLNINLHTRSHSIKDQYHVNKLKGKNYNKYQIEIYKFDNMLDEYYIKLNAQPLDLSHNKINHYYKEYFGIEIFNNGKKNNNNNNNSKLTTEAQQIMHHYLEGILWVFNYYYNDTSYVNKWYYQYERAPLLKHFLIFLEGIDQEYFTNVYAGLTKYMVTDLKNYFNPIEQLIYVSPMSKEVIKLLPVNYQQYLTSSSSSSLLNVRDPFLNVFFPNVYEITNKLWRESISQDLDCHSVSYLNKCFVTSIIKPTTNDDMLFLKAIRKVKPTEISRQRSQSDLPEY